MRNLKCICDQLENEGCPVHGINKRNLTARFRRENMLIVYSKEELANFLKQGLTAKGYYFDHKGREKGITIIPDS